MAGIGKRNQRKDYVIPVMLLTTTYISYVSTKTTTLRLKMMADLKNCNLGLDKCKTDIEIFVNLMTTNDASVNKIIAHFVYDCQIT